MSERDPALAESADTDTIKSPEVAQEMANAAQPLIDRLEVAKSLGLDASAIDRLGLEADTKAEQKKVEYEKAMDYANGALTNLLTSSNGETVIMYEEAGFNRENVGTLLNALQYRTRTVDSGGDGEVVDKKFKLDGHEKVIAIEISEQEKYIGLKLVTVD